MGYSKKIVLTQKIRYDLLPICARFYWTYYPYIYIQDQLVQDLCYNSVSGGIWYTKLDAIKTTNRFRTGLNC